MAYLSVYRLPDGQHVLDVQSDFIHVARMRVVVPLMAMNEAPPAVRRLHPVVTVSDREMLVAVHALSAVPATLLREPVADLSEHRDAITAALDLLLHGF